MTTAPDLSRATARQRLVVVLGALLVWACSGCDVASSPAPSSELTIVARDASSMTVHDIKDGQPVVASGIAACVSGGTGVTLTAVTANGGDGSPLPVTAFGTLLGTPGPQSDIPLSRTGRLADVEARSGGKVVTTPCRDPADQTPTTMSWLAWEVTGTPSGSHAATSFTVHYRDADGAERTVTVPVGITLCRPGDGTGDCRR
ncbi:hypothetical protein [Lapillicoccus jejuensis]|uniref:Uncharacterized protein n=1 Tax=Lapillicoccus jejuensis TaxID=402171 RepID=A0A542DZ31_9MICO|nr:hypothetical protein [Lapillicoccus jejuensis]TQJ08309.1 hypothetical protein FB458_1394 [Lapillicoccus jejuensis]